MLAIAWKEQKQNRRDESLALVLRPNLLERRPGQKGGEEANEKGADLPVERHRRDQTGRHKEDRPQKGPNSFESLKEGCWPLKPGDPREGPVIPIETCERQEQTIGKDRQDA